MRGQAQRNGSSLEPKQAWQMVSFGCFWKPFTWKRHHLYHLYPIVFVQTHLVPKSCWKCLHHLCPLLGCCRLDSAPSKFLYAFSFARSGLGKWPLWFSRCIAHYRPRLCRFLILHSLKRLHYHCVFWRRMLSFGKKTTSSIPVLLLICFLQTCSHLRHLICFFGWYSD